MQCHIVTGEYPPQLGGVSDYTWHVSNGLAAAGLDVHVWCPSAHSPAAAADGAVHVHRCCGSFSPSGLTHLGRRLDSFPKPRRILVQWVPHGYGYKSLNVPFAWWVLQRARAGDRVELMVHEPFLMFGEGGWKQDAAAAIHRLMIRFLLRAASQVWCAIPEWERLLRPHSPNPAPPFQWLPIPSNIPVVTLPDQLVSLRTSLIGSHTILAGHFGTFNRMIAAWLAEAIPAFLNRQQQACFLLMGKGSNEFHSSLALQFPHLAPRLQGKGILPADSLSLHLQACDFLLQPYPAGINSRQTTAMACLAHGKPFISTLGRVSEPVWEQTQAVLLGRFDSIESVLVHTDSLCADPRLALQLGARGLRLYQERFDLHHVIDSLAGAPQPLLQS